MNDKVANGDTANKIGTYQMAVLAKYHSVPFFVASPKSTLDMSLKSGDSIPIEERPADEMKSIAGIQIAPIGMYNTLLYTIRLIILLLLHLKSFKFNSHFIEFIPFFFTSFPSI